MILQWDTEYKSLPYSIQNSLLLVLLRTHQLYEFTPHLLEQRVHFNRGTISPTPTDTHTNVPLCPHVICHQNISHTHLTVGVQVATVINKGDQ